MKKRMIAVIVFMIMVCTCVLFSGCSIQTKPTETVEHFGRFEVIREWTTANTVYCEMYDKTTKVMYLYVKIGYSGALTTLVDAQGNPLLYESGQQ